MLPSLEEHGQMIWSGEKSEGTERFPCPCCGYLYYFEEPGGSFLICHICGWEDDNVQLNDPMFAGGANRSNLITARRNYFRIGAVEASWLVVSRRHRRAPLPEEIPPGGNPYLAAFQQLETPYACLCCAYKTFELEPACTLLVCPVCLWTDIHLLPEFQQTCSDDELRLRRVKLENAQRHFQQWGASEKQYIPYARLPLPQEYP